MPHHAADDDPDCERAVLTVAAGNSAISVHEPTARLLAVVPEGSQSALSREVRVSSEEVMRHMAQRLAWVDGGLRLEVFTDGGLWLRAGAAGPAVPRRRAPAASRVRTCALGLSQQPCSPCVGRHAMHCDTAGRLLWSERSCMQGRSA